MTGPVNGLRTSQTGAWLPAGSTDKYGSVDTIVLAAQQGAHWLHLEAP
jgi:hypothetical protein